MLEKRMLMKFIQTCLQYEDNTGELTGRAAYIAGVIDLSIARPPVLVFMIYALLA